MGNKNRNHNRSKPAPQAPAKAPFPYGPLAVGLILVLLIGLIWTSVALVNSKDEVDPKPATPTATVEDGPLSTGGKSPRPSGSIDKHRRNITKEATALLQQARTIGGRDDSADLVAAIAKGDESGLPKDFVARFRFVDKLKDEEEIRSAGLIALIQLGKVLDANLPSDHKLEPLTSSAWEFTYVDMEAGNAFVPLSLYLGEKSAFSFEYVWVDGDWVFSPYSLIDAISAADVAASGAQGMVESGE